MPQIGLHADGGLAPVDIVLRYRPADHLVTACSPDVAARLGLEAPAIVGLPLEQVLPGGAGVRDGATLSVTTPDGSVRLLRVTRHHLDDERLLVGHDITELHDLRDRLQLCEQQLAICIDHAPIGMAIVDGDDRMVRVNAALCSLLGYPEHELRLRKWQDFTHPDDLTVGSGEIAEMFAGARANVSVEKRYLHADGRDVWARVDIGLVRDERGMPLYRVSQHVDISERKQREYHLEEVTAELRRLHEVKSAFLSAVSHELRTPMAVVRGMAETLTRLRDQLAPDVRWQLEDALTEQAQGLSELLENLLELDRYEHAGGSLTPEEFDAVEAVTHRLAASPIAARASLEAPERLPVRSDRLRLQLAVDNLFGNVEKYAPLGAVAITLAGLPTGGLRLDVVDSGPGIPEEERDAVFEPFHRIAVDHPRPGTGIGLSLVARFARLHGGAAWVEAADRGAHLVVTLPDLPTVQPA